MKKSPKESFKYTKRVSPVEHRKANAEEYSFILKSFIQWTIFPCVRAITLSKEEKRDRERKGLISSFSMIFRKAVVFFIFSN